MEGEQALEWLKNIKNHKDRICPMCKKEIRGTALVYLSELYHGKCMYAEAPDQTFEHFLHLS